MHQKNIRMEIKRQLQYNHHYWNKLKRKEKKKLIKEVMDEVIKNYDFSQTLDIGDVQKATLLKLKM